MPRPSPSRLSSCPPPHLAPMPATAWFGALLLSAMAPAHGQQPAPPADDLWQRDSMTGDWGGLRSRLAEHGISFDLTETDEVLGDVAGGVRRGTVAEGKTQFGVTLDLDRLVHWQGGQLAVTAYQIHGRGLTEADTGNLLTVSNIEAQSGTRLGDLFLEQALFGGRLNLRLGQFTADEEFLTSEVAGVFINSTFGWPGLNGIDLPGGGPAYPYSTPGLRVRYAAAPGIALQAAVFNGNPLAHGGDAGGTGFAWDGTFAIVEATVSTEPGRPGAGSTFKLGAWYSTLRADDLRYDEDGRSLANPATSGVPAMHRGMYAIYAAVERSLWRQPGSPDRGLSGFLRVAVAPQQDRSPVHVYLDSGLAWKGLLPGRPDDVAGIAFAWASLSPFLAALDRDAIAVSGAARPVRGAEMVLEATYQLQPVPWLSVQPDVQYIIHPGGNIPEAANPHLAVNDALVLGLRSSIRF